MEDSPCPRGSDAATRPGASGEGSATGRVPSNPPGCHAAFGEKSSLACGGAKTRADLLV